MLVLIKRILKSGWLNFSRDGGLVAATCFITVITILVISGVFLLREVSHFLIFSLQQKVGISIYFNPDVQESEVLSVRDALYKIPQVKDVEYISKEKALESFTERYKDNPVLMESLEEIGGNPFLNALNIRAFGASQYQAVTNFLENSSFKNLIKKVDYYKRKPVIDKIFSLSSKIEKVGISVSLVLIILTILVAFNTIRLAILNQREEISIQRLVGASNWFIRGPFLVQGALCGIISAVVSFLILGFVCWSLTPRLEAFFSGLNTFEIFINNVWLIVFIQFATGILLGMASSFVAIRKYLKT